MGSPVSCGSLRKTGLPPRPQFTTVLVVSVIAALSSVMSACGGASQQTNIKTPPPPPPPPVIGTPVAFFGMHVNQLTDLTTPNIPLASLRMWDDDTAWSILNPSQGTYDWQSMDDWLTQTSIYGSEYLYDLARTPGWAQCPNTSTTCGSGAGSSIDCFKNDATYQGQGGPGQCFPPSDLNVDGTGADAIWIGWVTAVAQHSVASQAAGNGHIGYYEIWNEPNVPEEWQGTTAQLVRMAQDARCVVIGTGCSSLSTYPQTGIDPTALMLPPAFVDYIGPGDAAQSLAAYLTAGGDLYDDVIGFHGYVWSGNNSGSPFPNPPENFATVFYPNLYDDVISVFANQSSLPLFNTEGSWGTSQPETDPNLQLAWIARYVLIQTSMNIAKFYWYSWDGGPVGLWSQAGGRTLAGSGYGLLETQWLQAPVTIKQCTNSGSIWTCAITRSGGYQAQAVWDGSQTCSPCTYSTYSVPSQFTQYLALENSDGTANLSGTPTSLNGATTVQIGAIPILLENGNP